MNLSELGKKLQKKYPKTKDMKPELVAEKWPAQQKPMNKPEEKRKSIFIFDFVK